MGCGRPVTRHTGVKTGRPLCTPCYLKDYGNKHPERIAKIKSDWIAADPARFKATQERYSKTEAGITSRRVITKNYQGRKRSQRRGRLVQTHMDETRNIYKNCPSGFEVDHVIPLQGKNVSGLHVPWNLQYLTVSENRRKGRKLV